MTVHIALMSDAEVGVADPDAGLGALRTDRGNLPLESITARVAITGLVSRTELVQRFHNPHQVALEATYIFPLPDRAAVTAMRMTADGRVIEATLAERGQARQEYDQAIVEGRRAAIAEEERPDVFTMRVGNILPGEHVEVAIELVGPLPYEEGEATFRLPLVVAPRYIPGTPLTDGGPVGDGYALDTDAVPDASRITPPSLLPGFPNPVRLAIDVDLDPAGLPLGAVRSSLHTVVGEGRRLSIQPGERANRDFILRLAYGQDETATTSLALTPDREGDEGTFRLTVLPPTSAAPARPRDVVLLLDHSGSMDGWKMVAARRAAARIVDTLGLADRFSVLAFDHAVSHVPDLGPSLVDATDRHRFRAVEFLAQMRAQGGTELLAPLTQGLNLLSTSEGGRDRVLVLVTDGQVGNEDQILASCAGSLTGVRVHTVGIDQAVNAGFLGRLAAAGGGRCELVESEDRLDDAMERIHRRIAAPLLTGISLRADGLHLVPDGVCPSRLPDLFPGVALVVTGRFSTTSGGGSGALTVLGTTRDGQPWTTAATGASVDDPAIAAVWARARLRDLEDRYVSLDHSYGAADTGAVAAELERRIVATSLRFGVLCRFTAWLAVDTQVVTDGGAVHRVIQPVESPAGWELAAPAVPMKLLSASAPASAAPMPAAPMPVAWMSADRAAGAARSPAPLAGRVAGSEKLRKRSPAKKERAEFESLAADLAEAELAAARAQVADELRRLQSAHGGTAAEQRELLSDLGSRLAALLRHLAGVGVDEAVLAVLRELVTELADDRPLSIDGDALVELWDRVSRLLAQWETSTVDQATTTATAARPQPFWKR